MRGGIRGGFGVGAAVDLGRSVALGWDHSGADAPQRGRAPPLELVWPAVGLQWKGKIPDGFRPSGLLLFRAYPSVGDDSVISNSFGGTGLPSSS